MVNDTSNVFYVLHEGAVAEESTSRTWDEIVAMARTGGLSPKSLILFPDGGCKRVGDTELAAEFGQRPAAASKARPSQPKETTAKEEYEALRGQLEGSVADWNRLVQLAELALEFGDRVASIRHFQEALDGHRYNPRIRASAKRCLTRDELRTLRYLTRTKPIWEDPGALLTYPLARGPLYLAIPTCVVAALLWVPGISLVVPLLLFLWVVEIVKVAADGETSPPLWHGFIGNPVDTVLKPIAVALIVAVEMYAPFVVLAVILGVLDEGQSYTTVIKKSPLMIVVMSTLTLLYVPGALVVTGGSNGDLRRIASPRQVISAVAKMEHEYVVSVGIILALVALWGLLAYVFELIPFAGRVLAAAAGVYILVAGGLVVGRLQSRFQDELR